MIKKVSHEVPLSYLPVSHNFNDYDYCLPHLLDKYPEYLNFFLNSNYIKRFIIMDNGLFEGVTHTEEDLISKINLIKPNIFIVSDVWNDAEETLNNARKWIKENIKHIPLETELMVVIQGKNFGEMAWLYQKCKDMGYMHFAFNHSSIAYQEEFNHPNKLFNQMFGRIKLVSSFYYENIIKENDYIHLLGCSLPQEFQYYDELKINSIDTSNPVILGYEGFMYGDNLINFKSNTKIESLMEQDISKRVLDNIYEFKRRFI